MMKSADERIGIVEQRVTGHDGEIKNLWEVVDKVRDRLPPWAVAVMSLSTLLIGWLLGHIKF